MGGVCMTCTGMFGSGVWTGMATIPAVALLTRRGQRWALPAFDEAGAGARPPDIAARLHATTVSRIFDTVAWASVSFLPLVCKLFVCTCYETPPTHNNRSRASGGVWEVDPRSC